RLRLRIGVRRRVASGTARPRDADRQKRDRVESRARTRGSSRRGQRRKPMSIEVQKITKKFGHFLALDHVDLDIPAGQLVALLGPSGSGKTTLLRIIAGLEFADSGNVQFDGKDITGRTARERQVGFVFQHYALF